QQRQPLVYSFFPYTTLFRSVVDFLGIVPAAVQLEDLFIVEVRNEIEQLGVLAEQVLAHESAVLGYVSLKLAVYHFSEAALQQTRSEEHTSELQSLRHLVCRL